MSTLEDAKPQPAVPTVAHGSIPMGVLLHAAASNLEVLADTVTGYSYRGRAASIDEHMNIDLRDVTVTKAGTDFCQTSSATFLRGQQIVSLTLPPALEESYTAQAKAVRRAIFTARKDLRKDQRRAKKDLKAMKDAAAGNKRAAQAGKKN